mgnify:FL=1
MTLKMEQLTQEILQVTLDITKRYPELYKYINEMPFNSGFREGETVNEEFLELYLISLKELVDKYEQGEKTNKPNLKSEREKLLNAFFFYFTSV